MTRLQYIEAANPIHRISAELLRELKDAQDNLLEREFSNAKELTERVLDDLKLKAKVGKSLSGLSARPRKKYVDNKAQLDIKRFGEIIMNERLAAKGKAR